jgi:signal transduction histidine kinase
MLYSVETGRSAVLLSDAAGRRLLLCIFIGLAFAMFFYHMMVFAYRRGERAYLYFAMYCLSTAIRFMIGTNAIAALLLPQGVGAGLVRLYLLMMTTQAVSMVLFTHTVFNIHLKNRLVNIVYGLSFGLMLLIAFIPGRVNPESIIVVMIPLITVLIVSLRSKRLRDTPYNMLLVLSIVIFIVWTPINRIFLDNSLYMSPLMGNLFLLLSQCAILSVSYAETKRREEELTAKTDVYRRVSHNLRTPLTRASTSIQVAKAKPEMAEELLADAQAEIMDMAEIIGEALRDGTEVPGR